MEPQGEKPDRVKEVYEAPEVRRFQLIAEEVAVTGCKTSAGPGRFTRCVFGASRCSGLGS
jgi:hypothetical protein